MNFVRLRGHLARRALNRAGGTEFWVIQPNSVEIAVFSPDPIGDLERGDYVHVLGRVRRRRCNMIGEDILSPSFVFARYIYVVRLAERQPCPEISPFATWGVRLPGGSDHLPANDPGD